MIELGKVQVLEVIQTTKFGMYLDAIDAEESEDTLCNDGILLPKNQVPEGTEIGDKIKVFVYKDSEDRLIATTRTPRIQLGKLAMLEVVEIAKFGAFLDWGLSKDLFLPFKEQTSKVVKGGSYLVAIYVDKSERLCATLRVSTILKDKSPYKFNDRVNGTIFSINEDIGAFVAVDDKFNGLIARKELFNTYSIGDKVEVRVKQVRVDGKLELSLRNDSYSEIEVDTQKIMDLLNKKGGILDLNDQSSPDEIKSAFKISKAAFKRAIGRLLKEGAIEKTEEGIKKLI